MANEFYLHWNPLLPSPYKCSVEGEIVASRLNACVYNLPHQKKKLSYEVHCNATILTLI